MFLILRDVKSDWLWMFPNTGVVRGATLVERQASLKKALVVVSRAFLHPNYIGHQLAMWPWASHFPSYSLCSSSMKRGAGPNDAQMTSCFVPTPLGICARPQKQASLASSLKHVLSLCNFTFWSPDNAKVNTVQIHPNIISISQTLYIKTSETAI